MKTLLAKYRELLGAAALVVAGFAVYQLLSPETPSKHPDAVHPGEDGSQAGDHSRHKAETAPAAQQPEIWTCSMHPQIRHTRPGHCPICGMDLTPVRETDANRAAVETERVARRILFKEIRAVGKLSFDESGLASIAARVAGRVDRLYVDFTGSTVRRGQHLVDIYSPELLVAQRELLLASDAGGVPGGLHEAVRSKLLLWGLLPGQIREIEQSGQPRTHVTIYAPEGGTVIEKNVREGQYVKEGDILYQVARLDPIWLNIDIYEYDMTWVQAGQPVRVAVEAYPGEVFEGTVTFVSPYLDDTTRTITARVNLKNPDGRLKPNIYASAFIRVKLSGEGKAAGTGRSGTYSCPMHPEIVRDGPGRCPICGMKLVVDTGSPPAAGPSEGILAIHAGAVLDTGERKLVYRRGAGTEFEPVEVSLGPLAIAGPGKSAGGRFYPVISGLSEGDEIAVRGAFLIDSQRQIEGKPSLLFPDGQSGALLHGGHQGGH